jgi:putative flippase GtrA
VVATAVDFGVMIACVELGGLAPVSATVVSALVGMLTSFTLSRVFTFGVGRVVAADAGRYVLVAGASLALNAGGEHLLHDDLGLQYVAARTIVAVLVNNLWNYPMQRFFVFARPSSSAHA